VEVAVNFQIISGFHRDGSDDCTILGFYSTPTKIPEIGTDMLSRNVGTEYHSTLRKRQKNGDRKFIKCSGELLTVSVLIFKKLHEDITRDCALLLTYKCVGDRGTPFQLLNLLIFLLVPYF
jgi:hypothetical protein